MKVSTLRPELLTYFNISTSLRQVPSSQQTIGRVFFWLPLVRFEDVLAAALKPITISFIMNNNLKAAVNCNKQNSFEGVKKETRSPSIHSTLLFF